ncbi:SPOR domain-containing protein [Tellurirhabdus rosea]|uniref:SPOR domain-containing protein n=1 Tax=Tellurirhabdus rosea TaxID=2674997 RepID=UPI002258AE45|nr:SPOR domain-containing protein [Tellurirhabdus rosea]
MNTKKLSCGRNTLLSGLLACLLAAGVSSCASSKGAASGGASSEEYNSFNDDLTAVRPRYEAPARPAIPAARPATPADRPVPTKRQLPSATALHINKRLDAVLDTISRNNRSIRYAPGFRIQVYVGSERNRVDQAKVMSYQNFPELNPYLTYNQPTYRLKVGDFMRRMDAERYLSQIRQQFPSATMLADKVDIRRSLLIK